MDPENPPTLEHGIPDPETYLPGTPVWMWCALAAAIILLLLLILWLVRKFSHKNSPPPLPPKHDFHDAALKSLRALKEDSDSRPLAEVSAHCSLALRSYLAGSRSEPALYETVEEFKARQPDLPREAEALLTDLNDTKYAKSKVDPERARDFIDRSEQCLQTLHSAQTITS